MTNRPLVALLAVLLAAPVGAFAGIEKESIPETIAPAMPALPVSSLIPIAAPQAPGNLATTAAPAQAPAQSVSAIQQAVAPQLQAVAQPNASAEGSSRAGENATRILQGGKAQDGGSAVDASGAASAAASSALFKLFWGMIPSAPAPQGPKAVDGRFGITILTQRNAPAPQGPKAVDGRRAYALRRLFLAAVSATFGVSYSLPPAGPRLTAQLLKEASAKDAVLSDIDDTLAKYNTVFSPETVAAVTAVRKSGKVFAAITDRPDSVKPGSNQMSAFDSLSSIPPADRAGIIVATNGGGKIYEYQADGAPKLIFEEPGLPESMRPAIDEAAAAVKSRLAQAGTEMKAENHGPYGYSLILKEGTPEATVKALAADLTAELHKRGVDFEVEGRMAKDPKLPPYLTFSKLNKSVAVRNIAKLKNLSADDAVILGDSMYMPKENKALGRASRVVVALADRIAGPLPLTGNATDRNMERALPGALTLSVGGTADASMTNGWVLQAKGPEMTRRVLEVVARPSKAVIDEYKGLKAVKGLFILAIAKAGPSADRLKSEYWELVMSRRDEISERLAAMEKQFPSLRYK